MAKPLVVGDCVRIPDGRIGRVRISKLKAPDSAAKFDKAPRDQGAWYRSHGFAKNRLLVGTVTWAAIRIFVPVDPVHFGFVLFHGLAASMMLALLGAIGGIWSEKFDHIAAVTNFVVTPLAFLSGTFYSLDRLPPAWHFVAHLNPFFYMIDGFRYGFIGVSDGTLAIGILVLLGVNAALLALLLRMLATGYKLKA